jgi:hypothetical protein
MFGSNGYSKVSIKDDDEPKKTRSSMTKTALTVPKKQQEPTPASSDQHVSRLKIFGVPIFPF